MKILALDIATKTGWCTESASGTWDFSLKRGESYGMRVVKFKAAVREMINLEGISIVSYERPAGLQKSSIMVASEMVGVLHDLCIEMKVEVTNYAAKEIKKHATGNGNAGKPLMIAKAKELGYSPADDNQADAIHLYRMTKEFLQL
jgi:Holliday junction resolvasome RuvABC endonuclease subunit